MNRIVSLLRQVLTVCLVAIAVFVIQAFSYGNAIQAQAELVTPEASSYQLDKGKNNISNDNLLETVKKNLKETADTVREKLNLDEPIDPGTKDFLNSVEERVEETVEPITGTEKGSFQKR